MAQSSLFMENLAKAVAKHPFEEKLLIAPSQRVGRQWLDQAAKLTGCVLNVRVISLRRLMLDFAQPVLDKTGGRPATREGQLRLVGQTIADMNRGDGSGYFSRLPPSLAFTESLLRSLEDLEIAGVKGGKVFAGKMATPEKADEMMELLRRVRTAKRKNRIVGQEEIGAAALDELTARAGGRLPILLMPYSTMEEAFGGERLFLARWPKNLLRLLEEDEQGVAAECIQSFVADCPANEARETLRRILEQEMPLDQVETICLGSGMTVPALCRAGMETFGGRVEDLPFTFAGGIPAIFSRPVGLVRAWLQWLQDEAPPSGLADIVDSGLLGDAWQRRAPGIAASNLAARLKTLPIQAAPGDYFKILGNTDARDDLRHAESWLGKTLRNILPVARDKNELDLASAPAVLAAADNLLRLAPENDGKLDAYARLALTEAIKAWVGDCEWPGFDAVEWLDSFAAELRVMGLGPQPGKMHIADGVASGFTGRPYTFVLGMDENHCPGNVRQDPVLLDVERRALSKQLRASGWMRERRERAFTRLLARLRGTVTLSYARRDAATGREIYPAPLFAKLASADSSRDATLRPATVPGSLNRRDDWLWTVLTRRKNTLAVADLRPWFPHLAQGGVAVAARKSPAFTEWDGCVPEAGADFIADAWVLSPSQLELLAKSPIDFFFHKALGIRKPDRWEPEAGRWLAGNERGQLLHDLFQDFMTELANMGEVAAPRHEDMMNALLHRSIEKWRHLKPVRDDFAFARERDELYEAAAIFLAHEIVRGQSGRPVCFEASLGGAEADAPPWNRVEPIDIEFAPGLSVRLQGRVDRVDRLHDNQGVVIWDYKTGRSSDFSRSDAFSGGRHLQPFLYVAMLEKALADSGRADMVRGFSYFFPMPRDEGNVISYSRDDLRGGGVIMRALLTLLRGGCYPFARDAKDVTYSDYLAVHGEVGPLVATAKMKTANDDRLDAWRSLNPAKKQEGDE